VTQRPQNQQPPEKGRRNPDDQSASTGRDPGTGDRRDGLTGGADRNAPQPGHEAGSSGTSEYGRSDYGEPGDREPEDNAESSRAAPDESAARQSQSQQSPGPVAPTRVPLNHRH